MQNIVICDDEKGTCEELKDTLLKYASVNKIFYHIEIFYTGTNLSDYLIEGNQVDILFLDIALPGTDGIHVGKIVRDTIGDEQTVIVYISSNKSYALELFQNRPFDFLIKPIKEETIVALMDKILRIQGENTACLEFQNKGKIYKIPYGNILYLQSERRKINVHTAAPRCRSHSPPGPPALLRYRSPPPKDKGWPFRPSRSQLPWNKLHFRRQPKTVRRTSPCWDWWNPPF